MVLWFMSMVSPHCSGWCGVPSARWTRIIWPGSLDRPSWVMGCLNHLQQPSWKIQTLSQRSASSTKCPPVWGQFLTSGSLSVSVHIGWAGSLPPVVSTWRLLETSPVHPDGSDLVLHCKDQPGWWIWFVVQQLWWMIFFFFNVKLKNYFCCSECFSRIFKLVETSEKLSSSRNISHL